MTHPKNKDYVSICLAWFWKF